MKTTISYLLIVLCIFAPMPAHISAQLEEIEEGVHEAVLFANQTVEYLFTASAGNRVTIKADRTGGSADMMLMLYSSDGNLLFTDDDSGSGLDPMISNLPLPVSGQYRVVVTRCSYCDASSSATFRLTLTGLSD